MPPYATRYSLEPFAGILLGAALAGSTAGGSAPPPPASSLERPTSSTARMAETLAEVAASTRRDSPHFEDRQLRHLEIRLESLGADTEPLELYQLNRQIAIHRLRLGVDLERAIGSWQAAYAQLSEIEDLLPHSQRVATTLDLAFGYLRLGETRNCVAHHTAASCLLPIEGAGIHADKRFSKNAIRYLEEVLRTAPTGLESERVRARWLLNLAYMTIGGYPEHVPQEHLIPTSTFMPEESFPRFHDVAPKLKLNAFNLAGGAILDDFDNDGLLDIVTSTMELDGQLRYYRNVGDGSFMERTSAAGLDGLVGGLNCMQADYDNDGNLDILVLRGGWLLVHGRHPNSLLRGNGDGTFTDVTAAAGLMFSNHPTQTASWADYDLDGDLDLFVGNEYDGGQKSPLELFRNNGDGTFTDVALAAGIANRELTKGATWGDFNGDRYPNLYISNLFGDNQLFVNGGDGTFVDLARELGALGPHASFPTWFWDHDNDGDLDLFVAAYVSEPADVYADILGTGMGTETMQLYRGDGSGFFEDVTEAVGLKRVTSTMGANFGDFDGDGYPDIYLGTGTPKLDAVMPNMLLHNLRGERFRDVTTAAGVGHLQKGHGVAIGDIDNDGDPDIYAQLGGLFPVDAFGNALFLNPGFGSHFLTIDLVGTTSNRSAIGARVKAVVREGDRERTIYTYVNGGGSFGANTLRREIGLGAADALVLFEIYWPRTDQTQRFTDVPMDRFVRVVEGRDAIELLETQRVSLN